MRELILLLATAAACGRPASGEPLQLEGKLDDARTRAFLLTRPPNDDGLAELAAESQAVEDAAGALRNAPSLADACRLTAKIAEACASCHVHTSRLFRAAPPPEEPSGERTVAARMQRHAWAADRLWEGVVLGDERRWRQGLEVLAMRPVAMPKGERLAQKLQAMAIDSLGQLEQRSDSYESRAHAYGEMLVTCSSCHQSP